MSAPVYFGFSMPFISSAGVLPLQADERIIKNDLLALLLTVPGQRVMRPTFGTKINAFAFESMTENNLIELRSEIIQSIETNEPRVQLISIDVVESTVPNVLNIKIKAYTILNPNKSFELEVGLNLTGGLEL